MMPAALQQPVETSIEAKPQKTASRSVAATPRFSPKSPQRAAPASLGPHSGQSASDIKILRNDARKKVAAALVAGYDRFHDGDLGAAQFQYARALQLDESNRDAMLGLAAIAMKRGEDRRAIELYRGLWRKNPRDSVAVAAFSSLSDSGSARARESKIKLLLNENPHAAELHFALGTLYSQEQRWAEAQAAFLEAHKWDRENPDFMFNLAVSLDRLSKTAAAERYYVQALRAAWSRPASFDQAAARQRVRGLRTARRGTG